MGLPLGGTIEVMASRLPTSYDGIYQRMLPSIRMLWCYATDKRPLLSGGSYIGPRLLVLRGGSHVEVHLPALLWWPCSLPAGLW